MGAADAFMHRDAERAAITVARGERLRLILPAVRPPIMYRRKPQLFGRRCRSTESTRVLRTAIQANTKYLRTVSTTSQVPVMPGSTTKMSPALRWMGAMPSGVMMQ